MRPRKQLARRSLAATGAALFLVGAAAVAPGQAMPGGGAAPGGVGSPAPQANTGGSRAPGGIGSLPGRSQRRAPPLPPESGQTTRAPGGVDRSFGGDTRRDGTLPGSRSDLLQRDDDVDSRTSGSFGVRGNAFRDERERRGYVIGYEAGRRSVESCPGGTEYDSLLGVSWMSVPDVLRPQLKKNIEDGGMVVAAVEPGSLAAKLKLRPGDIVTEVNGRSVDDSSGVEAAAFAKAGNRTIKVEVVRSGRTRTYSTRFIQTQRVDVAVTR